MKGLIINVVLGIVLFAGSVVGALAATGRLNHAGTANIPLLSSFFPEPPKAAGTDGEHQDGEPAGDGHAAPAGEAKDASAKPADAHAADAGHDGEAAAGTEGQDPERPRRAKKGKSLTPSEEKGGGDHGGGHGEAPKDAHGDAAKEAHGKDEAHAKDEAHGKDDAHGKEAEHGAGHDPESDFADLEKQFAADRKNRYTPGGYFKFEGMPAGVTPEQINEAWQKVRGLLEDLEKRKTALDLREQELRDLADDIARRQTELGAERTRIEGMQRTLDDRISEFKEQVKVVRTDEVAGLKRNAQTFASFEPSKAADLVRQMWGTDKGQDEVLKTFEFMDKDAVNLILQELSKEMIGEVLQKRLKVSKEAVAPGGGRQ